MKQTIGIILVVLFLTSCAAGNDTAPVPTEPASSPSTPGSPGTPSISPSVSAPSNLPDDVTALVNKGLTVQSFEYTGGEPGITFFIKGDNIKKTRSTFPENYKPGEYFTHVYIDRSAKTAYAACLGEKECGEYNNTAYALSYETENIETPLDVLSSIAQRTDVTKKSSVFVRQRKSTLLTYTNSDGLLEEVAIENYYGLPVERTSYDEDGGIVKKTTYEFIRINQIKDAEVQMTATVRE